MHVRVELRDAVGVQGERVTEGRLVLGVGRTAAAAVVADTSLLPVAVHVHVGQLATGSLEIDDAEIV